MIVLSNVVVPGEGVRLSISDVKAYAGDVCGGEGQLTVTESVVVWVSNETKQGFCLTYPSIILHAVSRDLTAFPEECIYILVDAAKTDLHLAPASNEAHTSGAGMSEGSSSDNGEDTDSDTSQIDLRFVPRDRNLLPEIYNQLSECQALNPDEEEEFFEEDGNVYESGDGDNIYSQGEEVVDSLNGDGWFTSETQQEVDLNPEGADEVNLDDEQMEQD
uniref:Methylosome subunit pICln n=1 Tax=Syphacia muris TaxID=451379 RepID=A0A0N5AR31_9BILA